MHLRWKIGHWQAYGAITHHSYKLGVNSKLPNGKHILMWDFDDVPEIEDITYPLTVAVIAGNLSDVHILESSSGSYHAYCFTEHSWPDTLRTLAMTPFLDKSYFTIGVMRGYFTLRIEDKKRGRIAAFHKIDGLRPPNVDPDTMESFIRYWTTRE